MSSASRVDVRVHGIPAPQGSKRHVGNGVMVESSAKVKPWREAVKYAALDAMGGGGCAYVRGIPLEVCIRFYLTRPQGHYGSGRNAGNVKASAPERPTTKPDLDKLVRSTLDALADAGLYADDSQVVALDVAKHYSSASFPVGAAITVRTTT